MDARGASGFVLCDVDGTGRGGWENGQEKMGEHTATRRSDGCRMGALGPLGVFSGLFLVVFFYIRFISVFLSDLFLDFYIRFIVYYR